MRNALHNRTFTSVLLEQTPKQQQRNLTFSYHNVLFLRRWFMCLLHTRTAAVPTSTKSYTTHP